MSTNRQSSEHGDERAEQGRSSVRRISVAPVAIAHPSTIEQRLGAERERALRSGEPLSVAWMRIEVVDEVQLSDDEWDSLLATAVARIRLLTRSYDIVDRPGLMDLLLILPNTSDGQAVSVIERMRTSVAQRRIRVALSKGVSAKALTATITQQGSERPDEAREILTALEQMVVAARAA